MRKRRRYAKSSRMRDPRYQEFHRAVLHRDGYTCRYPHCRANTKLQVHHIKPFALYPSLRHAIHNGITLCESHHLKVTGKESSYESMFFKIISSGYKTDDRGQRQYQGKYKNKKRK